MLFFAFLRIFFTLFSWLYGIESVSLYYNWFSKDTKKHRPILTNRPCKGINQIIMNNVEAKKIIETNVSITDSAREYINDYIEWVENNIPSEFRNAFGVGRAGSHHQFGTHYGFWADDPNEGYGRYVSASRNSYYIANDFNCRVSGSTNNEVKCFVKSIPTYLKEGFELMQKQNEELSEILSSKVSFS